MKINIVFSIRESFPLQFFNQIHAVLTHSLPQRTWGLKVDENQHNVFDQSSALTHSLPQRT